MLKILSFAVILCHFSQIGLTKMSPSLANENMTEIDIEYHSNILQHMTANTERLQTENGE